MNKKTDSEETPKKRAPRRRKTTEGAEKRCSFCGKSAEEANYLFKGAYTPNTYICDSCAAYMNDMTISMLSLVKSLSCDEGFGITDEAEYTGGTGKNAPSLKGNPTPAEIKAFLDDYVIGQDMAKMRLAVAVYNHYKRVRYSETATGDLSIEKSNVLLVGESGTGKTLLCRTLAKMMDVPFTIVDATVFTEAGYVGEDIESILTRTLQAAGGDVALAEKSIVYIDEFDKLARKGGSNPSITKDVGGEGVQQGLLKMLEGCKVQVPTSAGRKHPDKPMVEMDTTNILFICGGAFEGIDKIITSRMDVRTVGYKNDGKKRFDKDAVLKYVSTDDLKKYGIIPELLGRIPIITSLERLTVEDMVRIIKEPKNAIIKQFMKMFELDGVEVEIDDEVYRFIVDKAMERKLGARGLRSIIENIMTYAMYNVPTTKEKTLHITLDYAKSEYNRYVADAEKVG